MHTLYSNILKSLMDHQISKCIIDAESRRTFDCLMDPKIVPSEYKVLAELEELKVILKVTPYVLDSALKEKQGHEVALKKVLHLMYVVDL